MMNKTYDFLLLFIMQKLTHTKGDVRRSEARERKILHSILN